MSPHPTMDDIKDIAKKDRVAQLLTDRPIRTNPFGTNLSGTKAYLRAERIATAVYLVTRHIPESEPARACARRAVIDLLSSILALRDEMRAPESVTLVRVQVLIRTLVSLVGVLSAGGTLSPANADLLVIALDDLGAFLNASARTPLSESAALNREHFLDLKKVASTREYRDRSSKGQSGSAAKSIRRERGGRPNRIRKVQRSENILGILGSNGELGIKDIAAYLPEYSEKMIQRELKQLIVLGQVKKAGSKRWSMYSLVR